jgi:heme exporter protein C
MQGREGEMESRSTQKADVGVFRAYPLLVLLAAAMVGTTLYLAFEYAPVEMEMGIVQKIFYFHVPSAVAAYAGFFCAFIFSIWYLLKPGDRVDALAKCGAEIGLVFCAMVLTSGPLWARPVWGTYFVFDPQLTATLFLFLIYASYLIVRFVATDSPRMRKIAAAIAIFGFIDVPIIHISVKRWGGTHPLVERDGGGGLHPDMRVAFYVGMATFLVLFATVYWLRVRVAAQHDRVLDLELEIDERADELEEIAAARGR